MHTEFISFTKTKKHLILFLWIALCVLWLLSTTHFSVFQWAMEAGGITSDEFGQYGMFQFLGGILIGTCFPIIVKFIKSN